MHWLLLLVGLGMIVWPIVCLHRRFLVALVRGWATSQGYELIDFRWRPLLRGPFFRQLLCGFDHTEVFEVRVRDRQGRIQHGWICCYIPLIMLASSAEASHVEVCWTPEPVAAPTAE